MAQERVAELEAMFHQALQRAIFAEASRDAALETNSKLWDLLKANVEAKPVAPVVAVAPPPVLPQAPNLMAKGTSPALAPKPPAPPDSHPTMIDRLASQMVLQDHTRRDWPHDVALQAANDQLFLPVVPSIETN